MRVSVTVAKDHLERLMRRSSPIHAVAELMWNGLDAEAPVVGVQVFDSTLGGVERVVVSDNGHGMTHAEAVQAFGHLGGSWKRDQTKSRNGSRMLHGKAGQGRFRAFALGQQVTWTTVAALGDDHERTVVTGLRSSLGDFEVEDASHTGERTGTIVEATASQDDNLGVLLGDTAIPTLTAIFAPYLEAYPSVTLNYQGTKLDPTALQAHREVYDLEVPANVERYGPATLTVIEWTKQAERALFLCDENGMALAERQPGIQAPAFNFTAYLRWAGFLAIGAENLDLDALHPDLAPVVEVAQERLRRHFRQRVAERSRGLVAQWKSEDIYPYEDEPSDPVQQVERELFDIVAASVASYSPGFGRSDPITKRLSFRLLKEGIEQSPTAIQRILQEVLQLPKERQEELSQLLDRTSLGAIIGAAKRVADRLNFLQGLEILVFDPGTKEQLLERKQLHKILAEETWVFGEQYALAVSDQSLTEVLRKHIMLLGRADLVDEGVLTEDDKRAIVDLMLSRRIPQPQVREHLIIELVCVRCSG
jgi:hypothetical protein